MKVQQNNFTIFTLFSLVLFITGCSTFMVKDTEGLRLAYEDIDLASSKGVELKGLQYIPVQQRQEAIDLYREAKASLNGYLQKAITDAAGYTVENTANSYTQARCKEKVTVFNNKVNQLREANIFKNVALKPVEDWKPTAVFVITEIKKLHEQEQKAAYDRFEKTVKGYFMKNYEELAGGKQK